MEIRQDDYGYEINFAVKQSDGTTVQDLSGVDKVYFQVVNIETRINKVNNECVIVNASEGTCKYTVQNGDFDKSGNFVGALKLEYSTKVITTKDIFITVQKKMA